MPTGHDTEARLARLEETLYFQEEKLKDLERHVLAQQAALDTIERQNAALKSALELIRDHGSLNMDDIVAAPLPGFGRSADK